jgi:RHS repeat-associated protein
VKNVIFGIGMLVLLAVTGVVHATTEWNAQDYDLYSGDFNGDGKSDILYIAKNPNLPSGIATSTGTGNTAAPTTAWQSWDSNYLGINWSANAYNVIVADFNGDGKADIFLQSKTSTGQSYLLLTSSAGLVVAITQPIPNGTLGLTWSADQQHLIAGAFGGLPKAGLFLQATSPQGTNYVVLTDTSGQFHLAPVQSWTDGFLGFKWSTKNANVFAGDFNGDGRTDLLIQAKPNFTMINYDVPFPIPTYPPNMNGVVLAQTGSTIFTSAGVQTWSRMSNGVDWSPLTNNVIIGTTGTGPAVVILQAKNSGKTSYELVGSAIASATASSSSAIFPSSATALSSNVSLSADTYQLIAGNYSGGSGVGLYYQSLTSAGTNYVTDTVAATTTASAQNPTTVTRTVEAASVGRTVGQFGVSPTGSAQYTIPIWAPPGPRGMQPNIALFYDSQASISPLGIGWSLSGLGQIARCNKTVAQDTAAAPVALQTSDGYCINGNRLRVTSGAATYGLPNSTYQTEIADFSQITAIGTAGNGPASFTVQARNGLTYYYGLTDANGNGANSQVLANGTTASQWLLSKVMDRSGNNYVINYTTVNGAVVGTALPSKIFWTPIGAGASSYSYTMQFNYTPNVPQSSVNKYLGGSPVSDPELLSSVEVFYSGTVVKDYFLGYEPSTVTGREELVSVQECADAAQSNCLSPTTITYQKGTPGLSTVSNSALSASGSLTTRYDLNGDGYPDLVYTNSTTGTVYVAFGSATGYGAAFNTSVPTGAFGPLIGRLTGGSQDAMLANNKGTWWSYTWNGSSFLGSSTGIQYDTFSVGYQLADINGDGRPDLIDLSEQVNSFTHGTIATVYTQLNTSSGTTVSFSSTINTGYSAAVVTAQLITPDSQYGQLRHYDFNGDGNDDLVLKTITGTSPNFVLKTSELISNGTGFTSSVIASAPTNGSSYTPVYFVNWNDDKCTDFVTDNTLYVSGCNGTAPQTYSVPGTLLLALDWDGDGRTDLLVANGTTLGVYLSQGTGAPTLTQTTFPYNPGCHYVWMDANGDGLDDLGCQGTSGSSPLTYYLHNGTIDLATGFEDGYGNSASPTYASILQSSNYSPYPYASPVYPLATYSVPLYVVTNATFSDASAANGSTYYQTFLYTGAWTDITGRGFSNFLTWQQFDSRNGLWRRLCLSNKFPWTGMHECDELSQDLLQNQMLVLTGTSNETFTTLDGTANNQRYFPYIGTTTTLKYELNSNNLTSTTVTNSSYDTYGNATSVATTVTDNDSASPYTGQSWTTATANTTDISVNQSTDLAQWCLTMLDGTQTTYSSTLAGSTSVTRTKAFTPDTPTACRTKATITEPTANNGLYKVTESLTFDSFGNTQTDTVTGANIPLPTPATRLTTLNWGATGQFLTSITDPSGATTTANYGSPQSFTFGVPDSVKNANNLTTSWGYDAFGRKTQEIRPDNTSTTWNWSLCTSFCGWSNSVYQVAQTVYQTNGTTAIRTDTTSYDPLDRVTQTAGPTVTGAIGTVQTLYNSLGLRAQQSFPFLLGGTPYQKTYAYDALNRLTSVTRPISSTNTNPQTTSYTYAGRRRTASDPYGNKKTTLTDVNRQLRQTQDALGYTVTRAYDSAGSLIGITDSVGNTLLKNVTYNYGIKPFLVAATDADRGAWTYMVDSLGERTGWTDAKGQTFSVSYDALSRPKSRTEPDLFTQWTWGSTPASDNMGQLVAECTGTGTACNASTGYSESRTYDSAGRLSTRAITEGGNPGNDPGGVFLFTYGYNPTTGLPNTLTYPISTSGFALTLQYGSQYGLLQSVTDTSDTTSTCGSTCTLWTANAMNGFGEITQETLGNGVVTNRSYDAVTSWLSAATAGVGGGAALLNQSYLEDENGNVIQRQDNNKGLTESFAYDKDNRLTCIALSSSCSGSTFVYDGGSAGPGNITTQAGLGNYTYPAAGNAQPHAVTSITGTYNGIVNPSFAYDPNGNMTNRASSSANITWFSDNYPATISANDATGSETVQFTYGPDRQRWEQIYTGPNGTEKTFYIGGLIDLVFNGTTNYRQYIYAGAEPIAVYSRTSTGVNTMSYMLGDHQGGVSSIASNAGATDVNESFSAFGARRNPTSWSGAPTSTDLNTIAGLSRQGYTFQTWLGQSMGLNHMNGRVEDAIMGRFLSPDPHITDPTNAQNYNRYSYVLNNPLTRIDPTGFDDKDCSTDGGCAGGSISPPSIDPGPLTTVNIPSPPGGTTDTGGTAAAGGAAAGGVATDSGGLAQSQSYVCGPCAQPGAQPDPSQQMLPQITVTAQNPYSLSPVTTTAVYIGFGSVVGGGSGTTQLFRAVSPAELASIRGLGTFTNPLGIESKYFSTSLSGAQSYAAQAEAAFGDEPYSFVQTSIPNSQITPEMVPVGGVDGGIETVVVPTETLPVLEPPVIIELP